MLEGLCVAAQAYHTERMADPTHPSRPRDPNQLAKLIADIATGQQVDRLVTEDGRDVAAVMMGRLGGIKGGAARRDALSPERRSEIAKKAAVARWSNSK